MKKFTAKEIEALLATKEYKTSEYMFNKYDLQIAGGSWKGYYEAKDCNGITAHADLFEDMIDELGTLPTQKAFVKKGVAIAESWWMVNKNSVWDAGMQFQFEYRLAQSYKSHVIEVHTKAKLQDLFPTAKVFSHDYLDYGLAVDIMMDYQGKRYSIHVLKDSVESRNYYTKKEKRTGFYVNGQWQQYKRDFTGHLKFEYNLNDKQRCNNIGGIALFTDGYIATSIAMAQLDGLGEDLEKETQVDRFLYWMKESNLVDASFSF